MYRNTAIYETIRFVSLIAVLIEVAIFRQTLQFFDGIPTENRGVHFIDR